MRNQFRGMRTEYASELNEIEDAFNSERACMLKKNQEEIESLFDKHQDMEYKYSIKRSDREKDNQDEIEKLKSQDANNYAEHKITLETDLQILEKHMEHMKTV